MIDSLHIGHKYNIQNVITTGNKNMYSILDYNNHSFAFSLMEENNRIPISTTTETV